MVRVRVRVRVRPLVRKQATASIPLTPCTIINKRDQNTKNLSKARANLIV